MRNIRSVIPILILLLLCGSIASSASATEAGPWRLLSSSGAFPPAFHLPLGVYDAPRRRVLVVDAGWDTDSVRVHAFEPGAPPRWSVLQASGVAPVRLHQSSIALDQLRDRLLLVGDQLNSPSPSGLGVWALTLTGTPRWEKLATRGAPGWRTGQSSVYDPTQDRLVVFGGQDHRWAGNSYLSDVWTLSLDSLEWVERLHSGAEPGGREWHGAIHDPVRQRMLVFGGHYDAGTRVYWNDVWELSLGDTFAWTRIPVTGPEPGARSAFGTVYDPVRRRMLVHGGVLASNQVEPDELWALSLDGTPTWTKLEPENPLRGRSYPVDVYDPVGDRLLACGGAGYPQTSALSLSAPDRWEAVSPPLPLPHPSARSGNATVHDTRRDRFLVAGGDYSTADSSIWCFRPDSAAPWRAIAAPAAPPVYFPGHAGDVVFDSLGDRVLLFDGNQVQSADAELAGRWEALGPVAPGAWRDLGYGAGVALDSRRKRLLVTGGWIPYPHGAGFSLDGVWALSLGPSPEWSFVGRLPQSSADHAAYYDAANDRLLVLGGYYINDRPLSRLYYGGTTWASPLDSELQWTRFRSESGAIPLAPPKAQSAFDPRAGRIFIVADSTTWVRGAYSTEAWTPIPDNGPRIRTNSALAFDGTRNQLLALYASAAGTDDVQAWALAVGPMSARVLEASRAPGAITIRWRSVMAHGRAAYVERREETTDWASRGALDFGANGVATFTDELVEPDHDYIYRLAVQWDTTEWHSEPVFVHDPSSLRFALRGARPNPTAGRFSLWFNLPDASPAHLEVFDLKGRRYVRRDVGAFGPGVHAVRIEGSDGWAPGVYFARLTRGGQSRSARFVLIP